MVGDWAPKTAFEAVTVQGTQNVLSAAKEAGAVTINYGVFLNNVVSFIIVAFAVFMMVRSVNSMKRKEPAPAPAPTEKSCPQCAMTIPLKATRCGFCTSDVSAT